MNAASLTFPGAERIHEVTKELDIPDRLFDGNGQCLLSIRIDQKVPLTQVTICPATFEVAVRSVGPDSLAESVGEFLLEWRNEDRPSDRPTTVGIIRSWVQERYRALSIVGDVGRVGDYLMIVKKI